MATYDLSYAEEHLAELFEEARQGDEVLIVRSDGRACQLLPIAVVPVESSEPEELELPDTAGPIAVPA
jgi:antitoxin (DNA-binding transcriptional repressor) of toxin-antitoxin stability system